MWHNPLAKSRSNLHQKPWEKQNYVSTIPSLENLNQESWEKTKLFLYPSTSSNMGGCTVDRCAHICAMAVWDEELLEKIFFQFLQKNNNDNFGWGTVGVAPSKIMLLQTDVRGVFVNF
jgi:hypothetical protein